MENNNNSNPSLAGLRKGAWTKEEDDLLRQCIDKYGEGKWHQVPLRAGLNRCRKSCRLRWLNYLRPNIKRGCFTKDEIDLILRLHKLLGNRWSLIAGRIPGRTANDVKNFWNTLVGKKANNNNNNNNNNLGAAPAGGTSNKNMDQYYSGGGAIIIKDQVIKPQPRTFLFKRPHHHHDHHAPPPISTNNNLMGSANQSSTPPACLLVDQSSSQQQDESIRWWTSLLDEAAMDDRHHHHYSHHQHEEDDDDDELVVLDKMLWSGPYGNNGGNKSTGNIMNNVVDHDFDIWGGIIGGQL